MSDIEATWRAYLDALHDRRLDRLHEFVHDPIRFNDTDVPLADYAAAIDSNIVAVPDFHWDVADSIAHGESLATRLIDTGTPVSEWLGITPTGKAFRTTEFAFYQFRDGKIAEMWFLLDAETAAAQLASSTTPDEEASVDESASSPETLPATSREFDRARAEIERYRPTDVKAINHNDVRAFMHTWWAAFDHIGPVEFFLDHFDDSDMTFNLDGSPIATDHASFRTWYDTVPTTFPWDFHSILDGVQVTGTVATGWTVDFFFRHVGEYHEIPLGQPGSGAGKLFNRVLHANWKLEHHDNRFTIRRYELTIADNPIPL